MRRGRLSRKYLVIMVGLVTGALLASGAAGLVIGVSVIRKLEERMTKVLMLEVAFAVSGVGPKLAISILSGIEAPDLVAALKSSDVARLTRIPGVGKKTAERLVLELKDKVKLLAAEVAGKKGPLRVEPGAKADLVSALVNLGYKDVQAQGAADAVIEAQGAEAPFELLFREALKTLRG